MALDQAQLTADLSALFADPDQPATAQDAASEWATAIDAFHQGAQDPSGDGPLSVDKQGLQDALLAVFEQPGTDALAPSESDVAQGFADGFVAYWTGATFDTALPATGLASEATAVVTLVTGASLKTALQAIFEVDGLVGADKAAAIAGAFQAAATSSVTVTMAGLNPGGAAHSVLGTLS